MSIAMNVPPEARKKYIERRQRDAAELAEALAKGDLEPFVRIGHQLKGNAATFGYESLAVVGARMEELAQQGDKAGLAECLEEFRKWVGENP